MEGIKGKFIGQKVYARTFELLSVMRDGNIFELISKNDEHILLRDEDSYLIQKLLCRNRHDQQFHIPMEGHITFNVVYEEIKGETVAKILKFRAQDSGQDYWFKHECFISKRGGLDV